MRSRFMIGVIAIAGFLTGINAAPFFNYPNPAKYQGTGVGFFIVMGAGTYNADLKIYDAVGNLVHSYKVDNFVINKPADQHLIHLWNLKNDVGMFVAAGAYTSKINLTNVQNGSITALTTTTGIGSSDTWMSEIGVSVFNDKYNDKIFRIPSTTPLKKAIIVFKGWDPFNATDGIGEVFKYCPFFMNANHERGKGWDIYIVRWQDAGSALSVNAQRGIDAVNLINKTYGNYSEITLVGFSMGGILGRYALAKSESDGAPLPVTKFISIEGEHQGAQINLTMQASVHHLVNSGNPLYGFSKWLGLGEASTPKDADQMLYAPASKDMLYYHLGLVESYIKSSVSNACPFNEVQLDEIRSKSVDWHNAFYNDLKIKGNYPGGYPSFCKNYAISLSTSEIYYSDKYENQQMANLNIPNGYKLFSDMQDLDPASYVDMRSNTSFSPVNGYNRFINFVRLESVLDLNDIGFAKNLNRVTGVISIEDLNRCSRFDKIYIRPNGLRQEHNSCYDDLIIDNIREILADVQPKIGPKAFSRENMAALQMLLLY